MPEIYLDNAATTRPLPAVIEAMASTMRVAWGNPSSQHGRGRAARDLIDEARERSAAFFRVQGTQLVFTSGATEANDAVLRTAQAEGLRLVTTAAEHASLRASLDPSLTPVNIPLDGAGMIDPDELRSLLPGRGPALVAIGWANGETGVVQPIKAIAAIVRNAGHRLLLDATQAAGRIPASEFASLDVDYLTASAHKMNGPQGVGCLILGRGTPCPRLAAGGGQEDGRRSGTENLPGIVGFGVACAERARNLDFDLKRMATLRGHLERLVLERVPGARINGHGAPRNATSSNITFPGVDGIALVARLDAAGVRCSQISACSGARPEPSRTLLAMGLSEEEAFASIRFCVSVLSTISEIEEAAKIIAREALTLRQILGEFA